MENKNKLPLLILLAGHSAHAQEGLKGVNAAAGQAFDKVNSMIEGFFAILPNLVIGLVVLVVFYLVSKLLRKIISRPDAGNVTGVRQVLGRLSQWFVIFLGFMVTASIIVPSITPAKLLGTLGFGSVAIGFAFKDILQNFLAGILILIREPFKSGDQVILGDYEGTVEKIDTRSTFMKTYDGKKVLIPNGEVYTNPMVILTAYKKRRSQYDIGIGYGDDLKQACKVILDTVSSIEGVVSNPKPDVLVNELAGSSVNLRARWWTEPERSSVVNVDSEVKTKVKLALDDAGIDMPYPTHVILHHDQTEEIDGDRTSQREGWPSGDKPPRPRYKVQSEANKNL